MEKKDPCLPTEQRLNTHNRKVSQEIVDLLLPVQGETIRFQSWSACYIEWIMESLFHLISHHKAEWDRRRLDLVAEPGAPHRPPHVIIQPRRYDDCKAEWLSQLRIHS
jgi:hypothetical protein